MSAKYKVGDKVLVRPDLKESGVYRMEDSTITDGVTESMMRFAGKVVTIQRVRDKYQIRESGYNWTDGMFIPIPDEQVKVKPVETLGKWKL